MRKVWFKMHIQEGETVIKQKGQMNGMYDEMMLCLLLVI